jgi:hypothetical protein
MNPLRRRGIRFSGRGGFDSGKPSLNGTHPRGLKSATPPVEGIF